MDGEPISARDLAYRLVDILGRNKENPLGPCTQPDPGCVRRHGVKVPHGHKLYCGSCWAYVLASELHSLLRFGGRSGA